MATPAPAAPAAAAPVATATSALQARATATVLRQPTRTPVASGLAIFDKPLASHLRSSIATPLPGDRLATVRVDRLPAQAQDTIRLIARGGPFPYRQDGVVFENREGLLPRKGAGYYHEYTVQTPGSSDRGARRLVRGAQNELYYTDDHYDSFRRVTP